MGVGRGWLYSGYAAVIAAALVFGFKSAQIISNVEPAELKWLFQWIESPNVWSWLFFGLGVVACLFFGMQLRSTRRLSINGQSGRARSMNMGSSFNAWLAVVFFGMTIGIGFIIGAILWMLLAPRIGVRRQDSMARPRGRSWF